MKWVSLTLMIMQMVAMVFVLRVSRTQSVDGPRYLNTTAIFFSEAIKFLVSFILHWWSSSSFRQMCADLHANTVGNPKELAKTFVPSFLYTVQNNLLFIALSHLTAATYQVTYQFKILTTAGLSVMMLGTRLTSDKWFALALLTIGVAIVNLSSNQAKGPVSEDASRSNLIGLAAVLSACVTSGFAGVYTEKILKQTKASLWVRNMQMGFFGSLFALAIAFETDGPKIRKDGFMQGYTKLVWTVVLFQAVGGLIVAAVMKYADNILKCFGCAIAIVLTCFLSFAELHEFTPDWRFGIGLLLVLVATTIYSLGLPRWAEKDEMLSLFNKVEKSVVTSQKSIV